MVRKVPRGCTSVFWWVAVIWFHSGLGIWFALVFLGIGSPSDSPVRIFMDAYAEYVFALLGGGCAANVLNALVLLRLGRKKAMWGTLRQLIVIFLACLPIYGPFYHANQLRNLETLPCGDATA